MKQAMMSAQQAYTFQVCPSALGDVYLTASAQGGESDPLAVAGEVYRKAANYLEARHLLVVQERVFGTLDIHPAFLAARQAGLGEASRCWDHPVTYIRGQPVWGHGLAGIQIQAVPWPKAPDRVWTLPGPQGPCGRAWTRKGVTFLMLQNIRGARAGTKTGRKSQTRLMFESADALLQRQGASYQHVVRTWIYLAEILDWYGPFNEVRNEQYQKWGLLPDLAEPADARPLRLPASTGIRGENPFGAAAIMDLLAVQASPEATLEITQMSNVRQQDAFRYHRAFSRGVRLREAEGISLHVSGTAAIDERGQSLYPGQVGPQVHRTIDNIEALVAPFGARLKDICAATIFLKRPEDFEAYQAAAAERGLLELPAVTVIADVCREELLFELDAVMALPAGSRTSHPEV